MMQCSRVGCELPARWQVGVEVVAVHLRTSERMRAQIFVELACCDAHKDDPGDVSHVCALLSGRHWGPLAQQLLHPDASVPPILCFKPLSPSATRLHS